jgi:hypothetical protein
MKKTEENKIKRRYTDVKVPRMEGKKGGKKKYRRTALVP